jgi:hypothetical protein
MVAGLGPVTVDEFLRRHAALALKLDFNQLQHGFRIIVLTAPDAQA